VAGGARHQPPHPAFSTVIPNEPTFSVILFCMSFTTLFFDLDDTVYENTNGLWNAIRDRMNQYMCERLNLPPQQVPLLRRKYYESYGTTLRGLQIHHHVDPDEYLAYVHDLPLAAYLRPDAQLRALLLSLPQKKWIFTNADAAHAQRVLTILDIRDCFQDIIDVRALSFHCKPEKQAYLIALDLAGESSPRNCVLLDDSPRNLSPAHSMGFTTVLVGKDGIHPSADYTILRLQDLAETMPELWPEDKTVR
jgi:pyrimidine 5'-nucleotidase